MMRNALIATVVIALALAGVWVWSLHPRWLDPRPILHHAEWTEVQRKAAGQGFPYDVDRAKARILLIEGGVRPGDWSLRSGNGKESCWGLRVPGRTWRICRGSDGQTQLIEVQWAGNGSSYAFPREAALRMAVDELVWVTSSVTDTRTTERLVRRAAWGPDFGPSEIVGPARLRGVYDGGEAFTLQAIPAQTPVPDDWVYRGPPTPRIGVRIQ